MANVWVLSAAALSVHSILFISIFDIYFTSPVETGMQPQRYSMEPPAKRIVLFVADGLRADTVFSVGKTYAPYLREIVETRGRWGVSHTHVPTESRPGHVAIIAGLYEDVSAVTRGWRENPVHFDSVFNQSAHTWAWGSPDILPMFRAGAVPGRVETFTYNHQLEDFAGENPAYLDTWVFDRVHKFFAMARENATHARLMGEGRVVFFLHLLGLDTNGHSHKPNSAEVFSNLLLVDRGVQQVVELFESHYHDNATAYVFTSDHGMTDWGSHGAGLPHETMTPLICWGAGIKSPKSSLNSHLVYHDGYSEAWNLSRYERLDVEQVDLAPLMSSLIGAAVPVNSEGVLPLHYIHYNQLFLAQSLYANARQLMEQVRVKAERTRSNSLPHLFRPFPGLLPSELSKRTEEIETLINAHHIQRALDLSRSLIALCKQGMRYYHTYHRLPLMAAITAGFVGWLACVLLAILEEHTHRGVDRHKEGLIGAHRNAMLVLVALVVVTGIVLWYQSSPPLHYLYHTLPLFCWFHVWTQKHTLRARWLQATTDCALLVQGVVVVVATVMGLEALVVGFFHREVISALLLVVSLWPFFTSSPSSRPWLCAAWTLLCLALSVFPLLPVTDRGTNLVLASAPGLSLSVVGVLLLAHPATRIVLVAPGGPHRHTLLLWLQVALLGVASLVPAATHWFFRRKESIPLVVHGFSWCALLVSTFTPLVGPVRAPGRLGHTLLCLFTIFTLMSTSYEAMFVLLLFTTLLVWLLLEEGMHHDTTQKAGSMWSSDDHHDTTLKAGSMWTSDVTFQTPRLLSMFPGDSCHDDGGSASLGDVRRAWLCLFLGILSFFGTGNVASINTFDPNVIYSFITVFSPFVMGALLVLKMVVPFVFVSTVFNVILSLLSRRLKTTLFLMLVMSDLMGLNFFFLVRDSGSWLEIGVSISHYVIMMTMAVAVVLLMGVARLLTGVAVVPSKFHSY